ncbi:DUF6883 domain-containing protein [Brevundimonas sp.]|uniref:DUF6883 domain-containing protein n=1 Tax=Brevundimonas sp. TaxID=1871086 RepID=UPI003BAC1B7A
MKLPGGDHAVIARRKIVEYCLSLDHEVGRARARVFQSSLGLTSADADVLVDALLEAAATGHAEPGDVDAYGMRYRIDFVIDFRGRRAIVRSGWIIRADGDAPELTTTWVLKTDAAGT